MLNGPTHFDPTDISDRLRRQAIKVWVTAMLMVLVLPAVMTAAPILSANGHSAAAASIYKAFGFICHQQADRSYHLMGHPIAVCARCFGVYLGLFLGFFTYIMFRNPDDIEPPHRIWLIISLIPISIDWLLGVTGIWSNTHLSRLLTGLILGGACTFYLVPAFVEITRNFSMTGLRSRR